MRLLTSLADLCRPGVKGRALREVQQCLDKAAFEFEYTADTTLLQTKNVFMQGSELNCDQGRSRSFRYALGQFDKARSFGAGEDRIVRDELAACRSRLQDVTEYVASRQKTRDPYFQPQLERVPRADLAIVVDYGLLITRCPDLKDVKTIEFLYEELRDQIPFGISQAVLRGERKDGTYTPGEKDYALEFWEGVRGLGYDPNDVLRELQERNKQRDSETRQNAIEFLARFV